MIGVQDASLLATPPARRPRCEPSWLRSTQHSIKTALLREHRRAGQSFYVVPRIEDIEPTAAELRSLVPEFSLLVAHGDMDAVEMDETMVHFASGDGDILLSTNIIENGLDVPAPIPSSCSAPTGSVWLNAAGSGEAGRKASLISSPKPARRFSRRRARGCRRCWPSTVSARVLP